MTSAVRMPAHSDRELLKPACSGNASLDGVAAPDGASELPLLGLGLLVARMKK